MNLAGRRNSSRTRGRQTVGGALPEAFPADIAAAVFEGVATRLRQAEYYLTE